MSAPARPRATGAASTPRHVAAAALAAPGRDAASPRAHTLHQRCALPLPRDASIGRPRVSHSRVHLVPTKHATRMPSPLRSLHAMARQVEVTARPARPPSALQLRRTKWSLQMALKQHPRSPIPPLLTLTSRATHAHPTSPRSTGFCAIWGCISSSSSSNSTLPGPPTSTPRHVAAAALAAPGRDAASPRAPRRLHTKPRPHLPRPGTAAPTARRCRRTRTTRTASPFSTTPRGGGYPAA